MTSTALFRKLGRAQYSLVSAPLHAIDRAGSRYLPSDSALGITLERGVDALDAAADRLLGRPDEMPADSRPAPAATRPAPHPSPAGRSDGRERTPASVQDETAAAPEDSDDRDEIVVEETQRVAEEIREELDEAPLAGELADAPEDEKQRMADLRAKHLVEEFEAEQRARHERFENS